jgi:hypothetical protein
MKHRVFTNDKRDKLLTIYNKEVESSDSGGSDSGDLINFDEPVKTGEKYLGYDVYTYSVGFWYISINANDRAYKRFAVPKPFDKNKNIAIIDVTGTLELAVSAGYSGTMRIPLKDRAYYRLSININQNAYNAGYEYASFDIEFTAADVKHYLYRVVVTVKFVDGAVFNEESIPWDLPYPPAS